MVGQISRSRQHQLVPARKHHWLRWAVAGVAAVVVLALAGTYAFVHFLGGPAPAPLVLPRLTAAGTGSASADGAWTAGNGSQAGYRVREDFLGPGNSVVGRTSAVTGRVVIAHGGVTSASFRIDLTTITADGKAQPQLAKILDTASFPAATFTLTKPIVLGVGPVMNKTFTVRAVGLLAMNGATRAVTFDATARYSGSLLEAAGSIAVVFPAWNIHVPEFLQSRGLLEFLLVLRR
jgi:polyisoprenoid-binding protein YceI